MNSFKTTFRSLCLLMALSLTVNLNAQLSGSYAVPGSFSSIAAAINSLNIAGVSGPVTIDISAGYTETVTAGGFTLNSISGVSSVNTIAFQKSGVGANPILYAYTGGTAVPSSAEQDGIWRFVGSDYIIIDGIDLNDPNTTNPSTMEFGYGFFKASATDGCQNNIIRNCVISLSKLNNAAGAGPAIDGSRGIEFVNAITNTHSVAVTVSSAQGANSNNKIYNNFIQDCNYGISIIGYAATSPFTNSDTGNDVGGPSSVTSNTIINFGGGGTVASAAIRSLAQQNLNVSYNLINSNNGSGINHLGVLRGIFVNTATSANVSILGNTITINGGGTTQNNLAIDNAAGSTAASNTINISDNLITNCTYATSTTGNFFGIQSSSTPAVLNINNNSFVNNSSSATGSANYYCINNTGAVTGSININNNLINLGTFNAASTSLGLAGIYNTGGVLASSILSISGNTLQGANFTGSTGGTATTYFIYNNASQSSTFYLNNNFNNISLKNSGDVYLMYNSNGTPNTTTNNNIITTGFSKTVAGGTCYGYYNLGGPSGGLATFSGNVFSNISFAGATAFTGFHHNTSTTQTVVMNSNTVTNISGLTNTARGINLVRCAPNSTVSANLISNFNTGGDIIGMGGPTVAGSNNLSIYSNTLSAFSTTGAATITGYVQTNGTSSLIYKNRFFDFQADNASGNVLGISFTGTAASSTIYNNLIGDLRTPSSSLTNAINAINLNGGTTLNVYYNSVYLNATSTGTLFGSSAINVNATPTSVDMRNNIFVNLSTATGTGVTAAYRRASTVLTNYATTSNNNLFYSGTPGTTNLIFTDGTNNAQTLTAYKVLMATRDGLSVTENPPFASTVGSNAGFLNVSTSIPTAVESGASPVSGITDDYAGTTRNATTPDIGAWEGGFTIQNCTTANGGTLAVASATACAGQTLIATSAGVSTGLTTSYLWKVGITPGGPYAPVTGGTGSTTTSYTSPPLAAGVYYVVLETTCAAASLSSVSNEGTLTVNAVPTSSAASTTTFLCSGQNITLNGSTNIGTSYLWNGPNSYTSASQNVTITAATPLSSGTYTFTSMINGCSSPGAIVSVTVNPQPATLTLTPSSASLCAGSSQTILSAGGASNPVLNFGTQANQNGASTTASGYPAPYSVYYGGQRMQFLVLASELLAAGFTPGTPINSIQFPVVSLGANWGTSLNDNQNFQVNIGNTSLATLTTFQTGLNNVVAPSNYTPSVGYGNTHSFSTPFVWNGSSNIILETSFSNNLAGVAADVVVQYNSPTSFPSTVVYRADNISAANAATATTVSYGYSARPDFKLNGTSVGTFSWSPGAGLSGTTGTSVTATPVVTTTYTLVSSLGTCSTSANITVNVTSPPTPSITASSTSVCAGGTITLSGSGATTYTWSNTQTTTVITETVTTTGDYTLTAENNGCPPVSTTINIVANPLPTVTAVSSATGICAGQTATLTGSGATSYSWVSGPLTNTYLVTPNVTSNYTVVGTDALGCSDEATVSVAINTITPITVNPLSATVCASSPASFTASGASTYSWSSGGTGATETITPLTSNSYTVTGSDANGCLSIQVVTLTANALPTVAVSPASPTICSNESALLTSSGALNYSWTPGAITGNTLLVNASTTSSSYTLEGEDANNCKNTVTVSVTVDPCTGLKEQNALSGKVSLYPNPSTGLIRVDFEVNGAKEITVLNSIGSIVMRSSTDEITTSIDLTGYAKGVYFVYIGTNENTSNYKIIIQ